VSTLLCRGEDLVELSWVKPEVVHRSMIAPNATICSIGLPVAGLNRADSCCLRARRARDSLLALSK
jgi:hypothetical protein